MIYATQTAVQSRLVRFYGYAKNVKYMNLKRHVVRYQSHEAESCPADEALSCQGNCNDRL